MTFKENDCVSFLSQDKEKYLYGVIEEINIGAHTAMVSLSPGERPIKLKLKDLTYMPPKVFTAEELLNICTYETEYSEFMKDVVPLYNWSYTKSVSLDLNDITKTIVNLKEKAPDFVDFSLWSEFVFSDLAKAVSISKGDKKASRKKPKTVLGFPVPNSQYEFCVLLYNSLNCEGTDTDLSDEFVSYDQILADIDNFKNDRPISPYLWTQWNKQIACDSIGEADGNLSGDEIIIARSILDEMANLNDWHALRTKAYSYYSGNNLYPHDDFEARDMLLKLMDMNTPDGLSKCYFANSLGYIFYYGRCNDTNPQYEEAFKYFSLGAAGFVYESMYKLADMYMHGLYVPMNFRAAYSLIDYVYTQTLKELKRGEYDCKFADAALRLGKLTSVDRDISRSYYFYTLADFAIRKRLRYNCYGDDKVFKSIQDSLAIIRKKRPLLKDCIVEDVSLPPIISALFDGYSCEVCIKNDLNQDVLVVTRLNNPNEEFPAREIDCVPDLGYCTLTSTADVYLIEPGRIVVSGIIGDDDEFLTSVIADSVYEEEINDNTRVTFKHHGETVCILEATAFGRAVSKPGKDADKLLHMATVTFDTSDTQYDYLIGDLFIKPGDIVIVPSKTGEAEAQVVKTYLTTVGELPMSLGKYKSIIRKA